MAPEELRLPMEAASARLQRLLRRTELKDKTTGRSSRRSPRTRPAAPHSRGATPPAPALPHEREAVQGSENTIPEPTTES
jgi:hypothetical protein